MARNVPVTFHVPVDLYEFLTERVEQLNRHVSVLGPTPKEPLTIEMALIELIEEWRSQVDPERSPLARPPRLAR